MTRNRLANEKSPYLLQHADNPVEWFAWGEEAFAKARAENKPIFLSIGYSTCHWCHVMAHESFEDDATAEIMNREFVNIKVDREERPDVDRVYMTFVQATTGGGGWPMSVWLTPELKPFVGGTYFPPANRHGQPGFKTVLQRIAQAWKENPEKISEQSHRIIEALREASSGARGATEIDPEIIEGAYRHFARTFDAHEGGFGGAPKFPRPSVFNFLTRYYAANPKSDSGKHALEMVLVTLRKMAAGGIHDHIGGGFHRYSVDAHWHVPHFEKMLYDQAQLASAYLDAFQITRDPQFENVARDILDYVARDMTAKDGGFYSAEDADSVAAVPSRGSSEHPLQEGAFYVWTKSELEELLGESAEMFCFHYGIEENGNATVDPHGEFIGKNIFIERHSIAETAKQFKQSESALDDSLAVARRKLFAERAKRPRPHLDDKIITAWNGLMISAFARGSQILDDADYLRVAIKAAEFVRSKLYDPVQKSLARNFREQRGVNGFAEDYAFVIQAFIDLYEASFEIEWPKFALQLQTKMDELFWDENSGGYFSSSGADKSVLLRMKDDNDSAEPAASSIAALNLARLAAMRHAATLQERAHKTINAFSAQLGHFPSALPQMLVALSFLEVGAQQIVIAGDPNDKWTKELLREIRSHFLPNTVVMLANEKGQQFLGEQNEAIRAMRPLDGKPAVYVCENFTCKAPVTNMAQLRELLR